MTLGMALAVAWGMFFSRGLIAAEPLPPPDPAPPASIEERLRVVGSSLRSQPLWSDEAVIHDWRIQKNCRDGSCRVLDEMLKPQGTGTFEECLASLRQAQTQLPAPPAHARVVLVLHGLGRYREYCESMAAAIRKETDAKVICLGYPSTQADVAAHAASLASVIRHLPEVQEIDLVAHSLGNIVIRHYWRDQTDPAKKLSPDPRIRRIVMVGPPNQGAQLARRAGQNVLFDSFSGPSGQQLARGWEKLEPQLGTPTCEFGIIAGGLGNDFGYNVLIDGDDDILVGVEEAKLPGARDFVLLPASHFRQMSDPQVQQAAVRFLQHGYFLTEAEKQPLP
ncbi:MAG: hypothetical protein SFX18_15575 [Pirellulales bacterium]|nr:hypothetical protein [Pirellulales bacterium]